MNGVKIPECWVCFDKGYVLYQDKDGYEFINHCICKAGTKWQYDGRKCEKRPSQYYIPSVAEKFDVHELAKQNFFHWREINRNKPGIEKALIQQSEQIGGLERRAISV